MCQFLKGVEIPRGGFIITYGMITGELFRHMVIWLGSKSSIWDHDWGSLSAGESFLHATPDHHGFLRRWDDPLAYSFGSMSSFYRTNRSHLVFLRQRVRDVDQQRGIGEVDSLRRTPAFVVDQIHIPHTVTVHRSGGEMFSFKVDKSRLLGSNVSKVGITNVEFT